MAPNPEFRQFIYFLHEEGEDQMELKDKPLLYVQLTQLACGSLALATRFNHCLCDGIAVNDFEKNLAVLTRGEEDLITMPNPDRTVFKARNPPQINHPHYEYSKPIDSSAADGGTFTVRGMIGYAAGLKHFTPKITAELIYLSPEWIAGAKAAALKDGKLKKCTAFQAVAARIWKARSIAVGMAERTISTMLFPVDCRKRVVPEAPDGFSGNALVPGFARETVKELKEKEDSYIVRKVQEGLERLSDEYVKSGIDWLEVNRGVPCREDSFSLVAWWRLGFEEVDFGWGRHICATPVIVKPGLVILLPAGPKSDGGLNVCLNLPGDQAREFSKILMEN